MHISIIVDVHYAEVISYSDIEASVFLIGDYRSTVPLSNTRIGNIDGNNKTILDAHI
ncbi:MAG: hypothetical protein V7784_14260 [Oceanospirillaceae bacterium]